MSIHWQKVCSDPDRPMWKSHAKFIRMITEPPPLFSRVLYFTAFKAGASLGEILKWFSSATIHSQCVISNIASLLRPPTYNLFWTWRRPGVAVSCWVACMGHLSPLSRKLLLTLSKVRWIPVQCLQSHGLRVPFSITNKCPPQHC